MHVLIIDDNATNLTLFSHMLEMLSETEPVCFSDPTAALDWCGRHVPDLVLVDYMMPQMDGLEFLRRFRALPGMGVIPLQFPQDVTRNTLGMVGDELIDIPDMAAALTPGAQVLVRLRRPDGGVQELHMASRIDTRREADWVRNGGVLPYVLKELAA